MPGSMLGDGKFHGFTARLRVSAPPGEYRTRELVIETNTGRITSGASGVHIQ